MKENLPCVILYYFSVKLLNVKKHCNFNTHPSDKLITWYLCQHFVSRNCLLVFFYCMLVPKK